MSNDWRICSLLFFKAVDSRKALKFFTAKITLAVHQLQTFLAMVSFPFKVKKKKSTRISFFLVENLLSLTGFITHRSVGLLQKKLIDIIWHDDMITDIMNNHNPVPHLSRAQQLGALSNAFLNVAAFLVCDCRMLSRTLIRHQDPEHVPHNAKTPWSKSQEVNKREKKLKLKFF